MPKKTREEKKLSDYRKKMMILHRMANNTDTTLPPAIKTSPTPEISEPQTNEEKISIAPEKVFFLQDFKKSFIFICMIITLEIIIYFASMNGYFLIK